MKCIPQLRFSIRCDTSGVLPNGCSGETPLQLASGNSYSFHADFIEGWLPEAAENMMLATDKREFQVVTGPGTELPTCTSADIDPDNGSSDYEESLLMVAEDSEPVACETAAVATSTPGTPEASDVPTQLRVLSLQETPG
ncbi:hypothetical protein BDW68DRAFT_7401 [Aspergillus falconensis]